MLYYILLWGILYLLLTKLEPLSNFELMSLFLWLTTNLAICLPFRLMNLRACFPTLLPLLSLYFYYEFFEYVCVCVWYAG